MRSVVSARAVALKENSTAAAAIAKRQNFITRPCFYGYTAVGVPLISTPLAVRPSSERLKAATSFSSAGEKPPSDGTTPSGGGNSAARWQATEWLIPSTRGLIPSTRELIACPVPSRSSGTSVRQRSTV